MSMQVNCPECESSVLITEGSTDTIACSSCGKQFSVIAGIDEHSTLRVVLAEASYTETVNRFTLHNQIGEGSFGSVWKAWDSQLQRHVALKLPRVDKLSANEIAEFVRDAKAAAQLDHTYIVRIFDITQIEGQTAIVSELIAGLDLKIWLKANKANLTFQQTAAIVGKIAVALHHAHCRGVVHRDLKPGNVMLSDDLEPKVIDFGLARRETNDATLTYPGLPLGTPAYMPPEQALGRASTADGRSDIYSLGIILFEMLTGSAPFHGLSTNDLLLQQINADPPRPTQLNQKIPLSLETICLKCLRKEPGRRFQTAQEVSDELRRWMEGKPILSHPISWYERFWMLCRRNPYHSAGYGSAAAVGVAIIVLAFVRISIARDRERVAKENAQRLAVANEQLAEAEKKSRVVAERSRDLALARLNDAREAVDLWLNTVGEQLRFLPGMKREYEQLLKLAEQDYAKFAKQSSEDPDLELERGRVLLRLGQVRRAIDSNAAKDSFTEAHALFEQLSKLPKTAAPNAEKISQQARLASCDASIWLGLLSQEAGDLSAADTEFKGAVERLEKLRGMPGKWIGVDEALAIALFNRGALLLKAGELTSAQVQIDRANQLFASLRHVDRTNRRLDSLAAGGLELLATAALTAGQLKVAERYSAASMEILQELIEADSENLDWQAQHGRAALLRAAVMQRLGRDRDEVAAIELAIHDYESITQAHTDSWSYQRDLVISLIDAARLRLAQGRLADADAFLTKTDKPLQSLIQHDSQNAQVDQLEAYSLNVRGQVQLGRGQTQQGLDNLKKGADQFEQLVALNPDEPQLRLFLALAQLDYAQGLEQQPDEQKTEQAYAQSVETIQLLLNRNQASIEHQYAGAYIAAARADFWHRAKLPNTQPGTRQEMANTESARAAQLWKLIIESGNPAPDHVLEYCKFLLRHRAESQRNPALALDLLDKLVPVLPTSANVFQMRGLALIRLQKFTEAVETLNKAIQFRGEDDARDWYCLGLAQHCLQQTAAAKSSVEKATAWQTQHAPALRDLVSLQSEVQDVLKSLKH